MNDLEKIERIKLLTTLNPELTIVFDYNDNGMPLIDIDWLKAHFAFVSNDYKVFQGTAEQIIQAFAAARGIAPQNTPRANPNFYTGSRVGRK